MSEQQPSTAVDHIQTRPVPAPTEVGQATAIEQSRAFAEVQAAVYMAHQFPRDESIKRTQILDACNQITLAERAFFSYSRGGSRVTGPSIHFARELARIWGNIQYGITELSRDDVRGSSQMIAYAWDLQTNSRPSTTFITPHTRRAQGENKSFDDPRDIYENNANMGARRVREMILSVLPKWLVEEAKAACMATMQNGGGKPLAVRIEEMVAGYAKARITVSQLEDRVGAKRAEWTPQELAVLSVVWQSLANGETTREEEFPPTMQPVTGAEIAKRAEAAPKVETPPARDAKAVLDDLYAMAAERGWSEGDLVDNFAQHHEGAALLDADAATLEAYLAKVKP